MESEIVIPELIFFMCMGLSMRKKLRICRIFKGLVIRLGMDEPLLSVGLRGATVARLTPDQKAACSNHVGVILF